VRDIRIGGDEILRRIYMVFQDRNWTARPWTILEEVVDQQVDSFDVHVVARGTFDAEPFTWTGRITGSAEGRIRYEVEGGASAPFIRNRLGLCVLHPAALAGRPVTLETVDGALVETRFPEAIAPEQPFLSVRALTHPVGPGLHTTVRMTGETFESEDHRNWSDASFKHYCTPISLPFPVTVEPSTRIAQTVEVSLEGALGEGVLGDVGEQPGPLRIDLTDELHPLPAIGVQLDHDGHRLTDLESAHLASLHLAHARVDIDAAAPDAVDRLSAALEDATSAGVPLVPALHVAEPQQLHAFSPFAGDQRIQRWLVFNPATKVTGADLLAAAIRVLGDRVGGGTNLYFTELNRGRPAPSAFLSFSMNPQVHGSDDETVLQNAATQSTIAHNARALYPVAFLEASPITLRPRFNPNATDPEHDVSNTPLPSRVDARQRTAFAAVWTVLSLKAIGESACLDAATYFEATGWEGLVERHAGSPQPADFPSEPGEVYPVYDVLAALVGAGGVRTSVSTDPTRMDALVLENGTALVANLTSGPLSASIAGREITVDPLSVHRLTLDERP
jgi:hypothetical protein